MDASTLTSMISPVEDFDRMYQFVKGLLGSQLGSWKTSFMFSINKEITEEWSKSAKAKSCFNVFLYELSAFVHLMQFVHTRGEQWSQGALWPHYVRYARDDLIRSSLAGHLIGLRGVLVQCYLLTWVISGSSQADYWVAR